MRTWIWIINQAFVCVPDRWRYSGRWLKFRAGQASGPIGGWTQGVEDPGFLVERTFDCHSEALGNSAEIDEWSVERAWGRSEKPEANDDDDDVDLFGSDSEEEDGEAARIREERLAAYAAKKAKKVQIIAKSNIILDVKPWDDETDLKVMETEIRKITQDGLLWGASKFVPVAFGIQKLSISCVVEDDKVSIDWLTEEIEKLEDFVQSVDIAAFNKI